MIASSSINDSVERFAALSAMLDDGSGVRAEVLAAAGLDEAGWQRVRAAWLARLASSSAPALASRFAQTYAHARQHPEALSQVDGEDTEPDLTPVPGLGPDPTVEIALPLAAPALPFSVPLLAPPSIATGLPERPSCPPALPLADGSEETVEVPFSPPPPPHAALPFAPPMRGRPQRLVRFDTATGRPLPQPYWLDEPTPPQVR